MSKSGAHSDSDPSSRHFSSSRGLGIVAMFRNVLRSSFNEDSSNPALPQKKEPDQTPPSLSRQHTQDSAGTSHQIQQQKQTQPSTGAAADAGSPAATQTAAPASDHPAPEAVLVDAMSLASQHPSLMSEDSPLADRLEALAELLPELKNRRLTNISSLWHTLKGMVPFAFGGSTAQAAQEWQLETSAPPSAISADSGRQSSARNLILNVLVALAKSDQKHGDCSEDMAQTRKEILRVICSASGWDEIVLAVQCATWASCNAQSLEGDPIDWFKRAKEWSDQAIGQCYPEDAVRVDPFEDLPDDVCACLSASLDFLANIVREEYPVLDPDFVSATVASLCVKAACTRPVEENGIKEVTWIWTKPEHLYGVLRLLKTTINYGALSQEVMRPGVLLLCTTVHIPMCAELCCDIVYRMFSSCYMRDALLTMNNILRDDNSPESTMPFYGVPSMTPHQAAVNGMVYFITRVMDTGPTGIQFSLRTGSCLPVLGKAAQCMHPEALSLVFPYLCTIVNDARADSMLADDWQVLIGILETTIDCRLGGEHNDDPDSGDESEGSEGSDEYIPLAKLYDCVLRSITKVVRRMDGPTPTSLIGLIYRLRNDIDDEIALDLLRFIDARGNPPPGAATWLEMLEELMRLYYFDRSRSLSLRRSAIRLCSKSFSDAADDSPSGIEHAPFVLSIFEQLCIEEDGELVKCALEILRPLLKRTRHPDIFSKLLQFSANAASEPEYCRPNQPMSSPSPPLSPRFFSSDSPAAAGNPAIHHIAQTAPQSLQQPSPGHGGTAGQSEDDYLSHHRVISVVRCLLEAFEWRMAITDDAGDGDPMQSASMTIELVNALLDLLDSEHAFPSVQRIILSVFLRLHADSSFRLYILQQGGDTVMDQRVSIHESARLRLESTRKAAPSDDSMQTEAPKFPISKYVRILTNLLNTNPDLETYHVLCQGLVEQLGNTYLSRTCPEETQELLACLISRHVSGSFNQQLRLVLSPEKRSEITALSYGLLTSAIHYKDFLKRDQENMLITAFYKGLIVNSSSSTTPQKCLHALSVSMLELPSAVVRSLPPILLQLIKISSSPQISVHLLEFVSAISRKQKLYATLRAEDYRMIFAVATNYIRFHNNQRRQMNASSASSKRLSIGASADGGGAAGNSSSSHSASTAPSLSDVALKQYILVMAYQVIDVYFLSLSPNLRAETVNNLLQGILQANFSRDSLDELNEVILDMILQNFNNASDDLLHQEVAVKEDLGSVIERTWIQHNSLVTIRAQRSGPLAQIIVRSPSAATSRVVDLPAEAARKYSERSELPAQSPPSGFASASESPATTPRTPTMLSGDSAAATPYSLSTSTSTTSTRRESIASTIPRGGSGYIAGRNHRLHPMAGPGSAGSLEANTLPSDTIAKLLRGELVTAQGSTSRSVHFPIKFGPAPCVAQEFISAYPGLQNIDPPVLLPTESQAVSRSLSNLDYAITIDTYKVSVAYVGPGQTTEREILLNQQGSPAYWNFLRGLGKITRLSGLKGYSAGLDTSGQDLDGRYTIKWRDLISQLVFHVGTLMPDCQNKNERLVRKKSHMGNDFVHIVFNESGRDYEFDTIPSEFNYVQIIVAPVDGSIPSHEADSSWLYGDTGDAETKCVQLYKVKTQANASIPFVGPAMEPKLLTLTALPAFVRTIAIHAAILSQVYSECKKNKGIGEFISPWRARLQAIKRIRVAAEKETAKQAQAGARSPTTATTASPAVLESNGNSNPDFSQATAEQVLNRLTKELDLFYASRS